MVRFQNLIFKLKYVAGYSGHYQGYTADDNNHGRIIRAEVAQNKLPTIQYQKQKSTAEAT